MQISKIILKKINIPIQVILYEYLSEILQAIIYYFHEKKNFELIDFIIELWVLSG